MIGAIVVAGLCLAVLLPFFFEAHWVIANASHFRLLYTVVGLIAAIPFFFVMRRLGLLILMLTLTLAAPILSYSGPFPLLPSDFEAADHSEELRIFYANVYTNNRQTEALRAMIEEQSPHVIILLETDEDWLERMEWAADSWPLHAERPEENNFGISGWSNVPGTEFRLSSMEPHGVPVIRVRFRWNGETVSVVGVHPYPPSTPELLRIQNRQYVWLEGNLSEIDEPLVVVGDFNTTEADPKFKKLQREVNLSDTRKGFGWSPTWPSRFRFVGIPIDHALVSEHWSVLSRETGRYFGSDHLPIKLGVELNSE